MNPKISIIIPVYNVEKYISECIESLLSQTFKEIEILAIDDCSTDNSYNILKKYAKEDSRIVLYQNKKNLGVSATRNFGLDKAKGKYISFVDSDDFVDSAFLEELYNNTIKNLEAVVCVRQLRVLGNKKNKVIFTSGIFDINDKFIKMYSQNRIKKYIFSHATCDKLYLKSLIDNYKIRFNEEIKLHEDYLFNLEYFKYIRKYVCIEKYLYYYRKINTSATNKYNYKFFLEQEKKVLSNIEKAYPDISSFWAFKSIQYMIRLSVLNRNEMALKEIIKEENFGKKLKYECVKGLNLEKKLIYLFYKLKNIYGIKLTINITHFLYKAKERILCVR